MDPDGSVASTTSAATQSADGSRLYLGNLDDDFITSVDLQAISVAQEGQWIMLCDANYSNPNYQAN